MRMIRCERQDSVPPRDDQGYLLDSDDWYPELTDIFAAEDGVELGPEHRAIVDFVRGYHERTETVPEARRVLAWMRDSWGPERATRRALYRLFPGGYAQQACKYAGMRKPLKLMLDV